MIEFACPTQEEIKLLKQHYRKTPGSVSQRAHAVLLSSLGKTAFDVSRDLFAAEKTVREWVKLWHKERIASIFSRNHLNENAAKLTREQKEEIAKVLTLPPGDLGIPNEFWDVSTLRDYVAIHFGVVYESPQSYHFLFRIASFSFKLPSTFDIRRNDPAVVKRLIEVRETIKPYLNDSSWAVLCADESRLTWKAIVRRVWLPRGKPSILRVHREHRAQNFIGFLDLKSGKPYLYSISWQNQKEIIKTLKLLKKKYPGKRICLVWDNARFHKGKLIRKELEKDLSSFFLINFPPYAPDTNPQEHIWRWAKDQIANIQYHSLAQLTNVFRRTLMSRTYPYQI